MLVQGHRGARKLPSSPPQAGGSRPPSAAASIAPSCSLRLGQLQCRDWSRTSVRRHPKALRTASYRLRSPLLARQLLSEPPGQTAPPSISTQRPPDRCSGSCRSRVLLVGTRSRSDPGQVCAQATVSRALSLVGDFGVDPERLHRGVPEYLLDEAHVAVGRLEQCSRWQAG